MECSAVMVILEKINAELFWDLREMQLIPVSSNLWRTYQVIFISFRVDKLACGCNVP